MQDVVADVRRLVHDLRPPALDDRGLVGALAQQAERLTTPGDLVVTVEAGDLGPLPAAVEVAAYRIASEALTNVARHAGAPRARVGRPWTTQLLVEVADDGTGIAADAQAGVGLVSLRERAAELGGRSEVTCPPAGGTLVRAWLPLCDRTHRCQTIRVVVVDDHAIVRDGLVALLGALDGIEVVGSAADGREALHVVGETTPDVVVMDIQMPQLDGIEATRFITGRHPDVRVVMLTMNEDDETVLSAIRAGASGYLLKGSGAEEVLTPSGPPPRRHGLRRLLAARVAALLRDGGPAPAEAPFPDLTDRERDVLDLLAAGQQQRRHRPRAVRLDKTVRNTVSSIYTKLHAAGRGEAIVKAREAGFGRGER